MQNRNLWKASYLFRIGVLAFLAAIPAYGIPPQRPASRTTAPQPPVSQQPAKQSIRVEEGKVTATITDSPLQNVLRELAERTGIIFEVRSQENPLVSVHLQAVDLREAIERIVPGFNTIYFFDQSEPASGRITLVQVFPRTDVTPQPGILYLGTGAITKSNDNIETEEQALKILAESTDIEAKEKAVEILVTAKSDEAIKALISSISDGSPEIRVAAIEGLAALDVKEALPNILKGLRDRHPAVRQSAATAVALLGTAQNLKDIRPLSADSDPGVAAAAETAIRKLSSSVKK